MPKETKSFRSQVSAATLVQNMSESTGQPLSAMIEIADRCNEVCLHCYQIQGQKGEMTTEQVKKVIDDLASLGVLFLTISGGEATLRPDFLDIVAYARERQFAVKIFTNGLTMTRALAEALSKLAVQEVQISLYAPTPDAHDEITGVKGSWQKTVQGMRYLREANVPVVMKTPIMKSNAKVYSDYVELAEALGVNHSMDPGGLDSRENGDRSPEFLNASDEEMKQIMLDPKFRSAVSLKKDKDLSDALCSACSGNVHIEANGEIRPCTLLDVSCGNALTDGVDHAYFEGETSRGIRALTWGDMFGCRVCDLRAYCSRCFARARSESGDALMPYASACHNAQQRYDMEHGRLPVIQNVHGGRLTGPYKHQGNHIFETADDEMTAADKAKRETMGWVQHTPSLPLTSGLVQLRRPPESKKVNHYQTGAGFLGNSDGSESLDN